jgi:hypothetical protein
MPEKAPLASVPMFDVPKVEGIKNPTGIGTNPDVTSALANYNKSIEDYANKLEQRYAKPNYFKIAAGFLKPQLGGFSASLGSANEAMAEQAELERAIAPTVAQMRSQLALNQYGLSQSTAASKIAEKAAQEGRIPNPTETADIAAYTLGPGAVSAAGQASSTAQFNQLVQAISSGTSYTEIVSRLPKDFVDKNLPLILGMIPGVNPPTGTPSNLLGGTPPAAPAGSQSAPSVSGVPEKLTSNLPIAQQLDVQANEVRAIQETRDKTNAKLTEQATFAVPIFEAATNLYKAASNPDLEKAFGIFEKGDPLGAWGKAVESGSFPRLFETARSQIIAARLGRDREKRAISDLQAMEGALSALKVQMQNGVINPTDFRSVAEGESIPGIRNTQDAFLRGAARIGSEALARYETKAAFDKALEDKKFNVQNWASSPYFTEVQSNAQKRTQNLITNRASQELPLFMQKGLTGSYKTGESNKPEASTSSSGTPKNRPSERVIGGTYWKKEGNNWVDTGRKAP